MPDTPPLAPPPLAHGLSVRGLTRSFPGQGRAAPTLALQPTDLDVRPGEFVSILGPSGCGKSTLLRIVAGLDRPSGGSVHLNGQGVTRPGPDRGMVFQSYTLFPWLTVEQNILFGLRERKRPEKEAREIAARFIARTGLRGFENHWPRQLSGGMQQRTALARALANDPEILLLDEPFGALDHQTRELMQELLLEVWGSDTPEARKTVLFVTHDIDEAIFLANRVLVMSARPGRVKAEIPVPLPYPRDWTVKTTPIFAELKARLMAEIREEVRKAALV
ncbi:ABC transporter ATP-binding protein [Roseomonas sp. GC11]|uniref:ABC transporter ATP-binding protein n=1 Tax=Roseomonas sp. GC11 TaxID=2950546 RepID=UPI00210AE777|nr:ABC transporter ATP-binding protein [Roseomonas sp. GC11]MCQ4160593.1 ABC transporter ATP-binding protein [Roseomonas sp. GC11]